MNLYKFLFVFSIAIIAAACGDDDMDNPLEMIDPPTVVFDMNQTVEIASSVTIDASGNMGDAVSYAWSVNDPDGQVVAVDNAAASISFNADKEGAYGISLAATNDGGTTTESGTVTVTNPTYKTMDQMGRPAINTVFNFFSDGDTKNAFNTTMPDGGNVDPAQFKGILDALQAYAGLDPATYTNALGLDNATTAAVLASDVLMSNKNFATTYGPSDLTNIGVGENVLNGRGLNDDVVDVTLILAFGADLTNLSDVQAGLISDRVQSNDRNHTNEFPYLASAN